MPSTDETNLVSLTKGSTRKPASVDETQAITYTATLSNSATSAVTVTLTGGATITIASGATTGTAVIAAQGEDPYVDAATASRAITATSGGTAAFEALAVRSCVAFGAEEIGTHVVIEAGDAQAQVIEERDGFGADETAGTGDEY